MALIAAAIVMAALSATPAEPVGAGGWTEVLRLDSDQPHGSTTFKDTSRYAHPVERSGDTHHSTKEKKTGRSSIYFDGKGDYLSVKDGPAFSFGVDDFVVEFWFKPEGAGRRFLCGQAPLDGADVRCSIGVAIETDGRLRASARSVRWTHLLYAPAAAYDDGDWHHVSFRREGDALRLLVDDTEHDHMLIGPVAVKDSAEPFSIGRSGRLGFDPYQGFLDRFVILRRARRAPDF